MIYNCKSEKFKLITKNDDFCFKVPSHSTNSQFAISHSDFIHAFDSSKLFKQVFC